jgi:hypothetical protein
LSDIKVSGPEVTFALTGHPRAGEIDDAAEEVVDHSNVLRQEPVNPPPIAPQGLHDQEMVELVPRFGKMYLEREARYVKAFYKRRDLSYFSCWPELNPRFREMYSTWRWYAKRG